MTTAPSPDNGSQPATPALVKAPVSPVIDAWRALRATRTEDILLVRMGDFYECFDADARKLAKALTLVVTKRKEVPMCGLPAWNMENCRKLIADAGLSVALAEEVQP